MYQECINNQNRAEAHHKQLRYRLERYIQQLQILKQQIEEIIILRKFKKLTL